MPRQVRCVLSTLGAREFDEELTINCCCDSWQLSSAVKAGGSLTIHTDEYFAITFGAEAIGMIIVLEGREVVVGELRDGPDGSPLAAKATGRIHVGDAVMAVNERSLLHLSTLEDISKEFREASRPVTVLFRRRRHEVTV